jgi:hypothetical protein
MCIGTCKEQHAEPKPHWHADGQTEGPGAEPVWGNPPVWGVLLAKSSTQSAGTLLSGDHRR